MTHVTTHVTNSYTYNSGGNVMLDVLELSNGKVVVISDEVVCIYPSKEYYESGHYDDALCVHFEDFKVV